MKIEQIKEIAPSWFVEELERNEEKCKDIVGSPHKFVVEAMEAYSTVELIEMFERSTKQAVEQLRNEIQSNSIEVRAILRELLLAHYANLTKMKKEVVALNDKLRGEGLPFAERIKIADPRKLVFIEETQNKMRSNKVLVPDFSFVSVFDLDLYKEKGLRGLVEYYFRLGLFV